MKKFRFQSVVGIVFIYLFCINVTLVVLAILTFSVWFTVFAVFLSLFQLFLLNVFKSSHLLWRGYQIDNTTRPFNTLEDKILVDDSNKNKANDYRQLQFINRRATNKSTFLAIGTFSSPGYMEFERVRCRRRNVHVENNDLNVLIGTKQCSKPYSSSILNVGAIGHEAVGKTVIFALSEGAKIGGFLINTGENGISPYHIRGGGDLVWQIGPGYRGCNNVDGSFNPKLFKKNATRLYVKMIEVNLCNEKTLYDLQGLAEVKHTPGLNTGFSDRPIVTHTAFKNEEGLMRFISLLRLLSGGKPAGIKICITDKAEFEKLCLAMDKTGVFLDFITIEGAREGNYTQMNLLDALAFARKVLNKYRLPSKIIASGEIITEYDILRAIALGADLCYSTRGMLLSLRENSFMEPNYRRLNKLLSIFKRKFNSDFELENNRVRVSSFHKNTMLAVVRLMKLCGYETLMDVQAKDFYRRTNTLKTKTLADIYFNDESKYNHRQKLLTSLN